ncbi:MAG: biotin transporter BioY [Firmicutes bacterium]|nr:biotin transporter BioY [Bacillota bacterium]
MTSSGTTSKAFSITSIALMAAVLCILGPLTIPVGPVPITLVPLAIFLSVYILGTKRGTIAVILYLLIGAVGVPVFSGFAGGFGKIAGPTGGYLLGYIFAALIAGWFIHRFNDNVVIQFLGMLLGLIVLYAFGTAWLSISAGMDIKAAIAAGVLPFVVFDIAKIIIAILLGRTIKRRVPSLSQM